MEIFHLYLRPADAGQTFEVTDDRRWLSYDKISVDIDQQSTRDQRSLKSLIQQLHPGAHHEGARPDTSCRSDR